MSDRVRWRQAQQQERELHGQVTVGRLVRGKLAGRRQGSGPHSGRFGGWRWWLGAGFVDGAKSNHHVTSMSRQLPCVAQHSVLDVSPNSQRLPPVQRAPMGPSNAASTTLNEDPLTRSAGLQRGQLSWTLVPSHTCSTSLKRARCQPLPLACSTGLRRAHFAAVSSDFHFFTYDNETHLIYTFRLVFNLTTNLSYTLTTSIVLRLLPFLSHLFSRSVPFT